MSNTMIHAGKCRGTIYPDVTGLFVIKSPSLVVSTKGLSLGPLEIQFKGNSPTVDLICAKCEKKIPQEKYAEEILVECDLCHKHHPADETFTSRSISRFCQNCRDVMAGKEGAVAPEELKSAIKWLAVPSDSQVKPVSEVLKTKISV